MRWCALSWISWHCQVRRCWHRLRGQAVRVGCAASLLVRYGPLDLLSCLPSPFCLPQASPFTAKELPATEQHDSQYDLRQCWRLLTAMMDGTHWAIETVENSLRCLASAARKKMDTGSNGHSSHYDMKFSRNIVPLHMSCFQGGRSQACRDLMHKWTFCRKLALVLGSLKICSCAL